MGRDSFQEKADELLARMLGVEKNLLNLHQLIGGTNTIVPAQQKPIE
jgi:hypothetical protein